ncbi:MAG: hypothetical protein E7568_06395 [Ruminococcaceae bacterium]|nr:hypothetical protein [Oscillospiraceae bacterium]
MKRRAQEIILQANNMLGYENAAELTKQAVAAVNTIAMDIYYTLGLTGYKMITGVNDELEFDEEIINDIIPHGVASLIAEMMDDGDKQQLYAAYYNRKRAKLTKITEIKDTLPIGEY